MRIDSDIKLDYKDVLIRPKRSTLKSRSQVQLERKFTFRHSKHDYEGVPIMASNMDGVGTFAMADKLAEGGIFTCLVKTYSQEEIALYFTEGIKERTENVAMSIGTSWEDFDKLSAVVTMVGEDLKYVCMDIANGYSDHFAQHVKKVRHAFPDLVIIAGNVVTGEMTEELFLQVQILLKWVLALVVFVLLGFKLGWDIRNSQQLLSVLMLLMVLAVTSLLMVAVLALGTLLKHLLAALTL